MSDEFQPDFAPARQFPIRPENRPGLERLRYAIGRYPEIREALFRHLSNEPALAGWTHRRADDPGIALLESAAIVADILAFYQELYANEAFLRTALWRESIADLVRLYGYRLSPGLGGRASFALELRQRSSVVVPKGFPIKADLEAAMPSAAEFETSGELAAHLHLSRFPVYLPRRYDTVIASGSTEFEIEAVAGREHPEAIAAVDLKKGDQLLLLPSTRMWDELVTADSAIQKRLQIVKIAGVKSRYGRTVITIEGSLAATWIAPAHAYRINRSFKHFGWNAPPKIVTPSASSVSVDDTRYLRHLNHVCVEPTLDRGLSMDAFPLDAEVKDLTPGQLVIIEATVKQLATDLAPRPLAVTRRIADNRAETLTFGNLSGASSWLTFTQNLATSDGVIVGVDIRTFRLHETTSPALALRPVAKAVTVMGADPVCFFGTERQAQMLVQRRLWFQKKEGEGFERVCIGIGKGESTAAGWAAEAEMWEAPSLTQADAKSSFVASTMVVSSGVAAKTMEAFTGVQPVSTASGLSLSSIAPILAPPISSVTAGMVDMKWIPIINAFADVEIHSSGLPDRVSGEADFAKLWALRFDAPLTPLVAADFPDDFPEGKPPVTVFGNLVDATQGRTQPLTVIGSGDMRVPFQTFKLPRTPLTHHLSASATPPEAPELDVYVAGRKWTRVPSFYGHGAKEEIYILREDARHEFWVQFGDDDTGARLPSGIDNVAVRMRVGSGAFGPAREGALPSAGERLEGLDKIHLLGVVGGGSAPEQAAKARQAAPGKVQSLGRLVSLRDYETEVLGMSGVVSCKASWDEMDGGMVVRLRVLLESGREKEMGRLRDVIATAQRQRGPRRHAVVVEQAFHRWVWLQLRYSHDPSLIREDVESGIRQSLGLYGDDSAERSGVFGLRRRELGGKEYASRVEGAVQNVSGVLWCRLTAWGRFDFGNDPLTTEPPALTSPASAVLPCSPEHLLRLHPRHVGLTAVDATSPATP